MRHAISFLIAVLISVISYGQKDAISVSLDHSPLPVLIEQIEKETSYRFYFLSSWVDSVKVSVNVEQATIPAILVKALRGTGLNFFIHDKQIILTEGIQLTSQADTAYFNSYSNDASSLAAVGRPLPVEENDDVKNAIRQVGKRGAPVKQKYSVTGFVREKRSNEPLTGVLVYVKGSGNGTMTDPYGYYSIGVSPGESTLTVSLMGMKTSTQKILVIGDGKLDLMMEEEVKQLKEILIESDADFNVSGIQMGMSKIDIQSMKNIPKVFGENDLLKVATTLPGVKSIGEGASGLNVRGGHADQNLVILNEATIYNTSHFLGFFSVFNPDAIRSFELYKSGIPVQYGGRLSSTFELLMRDGNQKKFAGQGGIGPITSHLTLEVPLIKDKTSLMAGGRTTYSNWILRSIDKSVLNNTAVSFYDLFARVTHTANDRNTFYLSLYASNDKFNLSSDTTFAYTNQLVSFQWRHVFNANLDGVLSITRSNYHYNIDYTSLPPEAFNMGFAVTESNIKYEFNRSRGKHKINYGFQSKLYDIDPGFIEKGSDSSLVKPKVVARETGVESALFIADNLEISPVFSLYYGVRYSMFSALGPRVLYTYLPGSPRRENTIEDTVHYGNYKLIKNFHGPEYRVALRYKLGDNSAVKASYNRTRQYVHMLSNTVSVSPTDTWKLSDPHVLPQVADQVSMGFYQDLKSKVYELSMEVYYKWIQNILDYKTGATLLVNEHIDQEILQGDARAYGIELLLRKKSGQVTGWLGYSYSRTLVRLNSPLLTERVNNGNYFPANYDKPHDLSLITNYKITRRYSFALNFLYSSGRPITYPIAAYRYGNAYRVQYSDRNAFRIPDYVRVDVGFNIEGNHRIKKLAHSYWSISIYNLLGRKNPYSIFFRVVDTDIKAYQLSIFGAPVPTVTYHFKF
jgi:hypothetical protein